MSNTAEIRHDYQRNSLLEENASPSPFDQFDLWFKEAIAAKLPDPNAMTLATADERGRPSARIVLIKDMDERGATFFTNYESRKGHDLMANNRAALLFFWPQLERQIRLEGRVKKISAKESDAYFESRPLGSRIGAWASPQSQVIPSRTALDARAAAFEAEFGQHPPRPLHWGGYRLVPSLFEFWQGRPNRLHDRLVYRLKSGKWIMERLAP